MDVAYDHIQEESLSPEEMAATIKKTSNTEPPAESTSTEKPGQTQQPPKQTLNAEFQEAYNSILTTTPWGAKLGGFLSDVKKQSTSLYDEARQEATAAGGEAFKGFTDLRQSLVSRARSLSTGQEKKKPRESTAERADVSRDQSEKIPEGEAAEESEGMVSRFKAEAAKRLKELEKAEEAADAAIFRFGANIGTFLKDAVSIAPPSESEKNKDGSSKVLFESKSEDGKRVIHGTRLEAQLHAIHTSRDKFLKDSEGEEWEKWKEDWDLDKERGSIGKDEERFEELRRMREKIVPAEVKEEDFWRRYYFLRMIVESEEQRRKEVLKGAAQSDETVSWDDDSSDDEQQSSTPQLPTSSTRPSAPGNASPASLTTIHPTSDGGTLKASNPRRSQDEKSQPDSDSSYDLVSGATSQAPGSPKETKKADEEEEEDWE